jgi:peroxiredoxin
VRQVADYQAHLEEFTAENTDIVALSVDPLDKAQEMVAKTGATFPIGYGLKVPEDADRVGAYWEERRGIIHATNFTLGPDRKVLQACFATGPIGRIAAVDALSSIRGTKKRKAKGG